VFACLGIATRVGANEADQKMCENPPSNGTWHGLAADGSKCVCKPGYFNNRVIPKQWKRNMELLAGKGEINAVITDVCTKIDDVAAASKKHKIAIVEAKPEKPVAAAPVPPPTCSAKHGSIRVKSDEVASNDVECNGPGVSSIERMSVTCNNCNPPESKNITVAKKLRTHTETVSVRYSDSDQSASVVTANIFTAKEKIEVQWEIIWVQKKAPTPVDSPAKIACEGPPSYGKWSPETQTCACFGNRVLVNGVCVDKVVPPPAPVKKYVEGTIVHPYVEALGSYGYSKSFHSDNYGLGVGAGFDASSYLRIFGGAGLELQGGTKLDANKKPVVLADGSVDKRSTSAYFILGLQIRPIDLLGINVGVVRQMRGTTGGIVNALSVTTGGSLGASVLLPIDGATFDLGADFLVGTHQFQSFAADAEFGVIVRARVWFFNPRHLVEIQR